MPAHRLSGRSASRVLLAACPVMLALLLFVGRWLTFWTDEWAFILQRRDPGIDTLFAPNVDHFSLVPVLVWQGLFRIAGLGSYYPYLFVSWLLHFACVWLLFGIAAQRAGWAMGLAAGLSLLFLGSGFENLLHAFLMSFLFSEAAGLLALALLLRTDPAPRAPLRAIGAALALCVAAASSGAGMLFVWLVAGWTVLRRDRWGLAATLPAIVLFVIWFGTWGRPPAEVKGITAPDLLWAPIQIAYGLGAAVTAVLGMPPHRFAALGIPIGGAAALAARALGARISPLGIAALGALLAEYVLQTVFRSGFGIAHAARSAYLYLAVIFVWLIVADVAASSGFRLRDRRVVRAVAGALLLMIVGNMIQFVRAARAMRPLRATEIAELRLLEALRGSPDLDLSTSPDPGLLLGVTARRYFEAIDRLGAPRLFCCEPTWNALGPVDPRQLDQALLRLVGRGIRSAPAAAHSEPAPEVLADGEPVARASDPRCVTVGPRDRATTARWRPSRDAFLVRPIEPSATPPVVRVGVFARPSHPLDPALLSPAAGGRPVRLPRLPGELAWVLEVDVPAGQRVEICSALGVQAPVQSALGPGAALLAQRTLRAAGGSACTARRHAAA